MLQQLLVTTQHTQALHAQPGVMQLYLLMCILQQLLVTTQHTHASHAEPGVMQWYLQQLLVTM